MNSMNYHKTILLDFDGTILDSESAYLKIMMDYNKKHNFYISKNFYIKNLLGKSKDEISHILKLKLKKRFNEEIYWDGLLKYRDEYLNNNTINKKNGFDDFITYLKKNNYLIGIVTSNSLQLIYKLLENASVDKNLFNFIVCRENVLRIKPYPDLYKLAIKLANTDIKNIIAIEDSSIGILSALNAELNVIRIKDIGIIKKKLQKKCCLNANSFYEVIDFLEYLGGKNGNN